MFCLAFKFNHVLTFTSLGLVLFWYLCRSAFVAFVLSQNMTSFVAVFAGLIAVGASVESFSIAPSSPLVNKLKETITSTSTSALYSTKAQENNAHVAATFWGSPRNEQEIIDFVSDAVFNDDNGNDNEHHDHEAQNDYSPQEANVVQDRQWVEVISAEPPVRRIVISHIFTQIIQLEYTKPSSSVPSF